MADPAAAPAPPGAATTAPAVRQPSVRSVNPGNGSNGVLRDAFISAEVSLPNGGIDPTTLTLSTVYLYRRSDGKRVPAVLNTSAAGDVVILRPLALLEPGVKYGFDVTDGLKDTTGAPFKYFVSTFTAGPGASSTDPNVHFEKVALPGTAGHEYLGLAVGSDGKLYAGTSTGHVARFPINADGTLGAAELIDSLIRANGGPRFVQGLAFDPASTPDNPVLWASHTAATWSDGPDWTGTISRLSGAGLGTVQDKVVHLPRSFRDHVTNQIVFGPDGALYFNQASNTAMGAPDAAWGGRPERLLTSAVLRLDTAALGGAALDARTPDGGGSYNPFAAGVPLTIYASGVRNAYDLVFHSNGGLYAPANGSAAGGSAPGTPNPFAVPYSPRIDETKAGPYLGPPVPGLSGVTEPESDFLFRLDQGRYYGHPNPLRHEYVLNGGNPTRGADPFEVTDYPVGTNPDRNWRPAVYDFGIHQSPNGAIEYRGPAFNGALDRKILVVRYSGGDDIVALGLDEGGKVAEAYTGMTGMTGFDNPLDLVEHLLSGNLYVSELGGKRITLLRPAGTSGGVGSGNGSGNSGGPDTPPPESPGEPGPGNPGDGNVGGGAPGDGQGAPPPVDSSPPPPEPPPPPPPPPTRSRREQRFIRRIEKFATRHDLAVPDVTSVAAAELKNVYAGLKDQRRRDEIVVKITKLAGKKSFALPNLTTYSLHQLIDLRKSVLKAEVAKPQGV